MAALVQGTAHIFGIGNTVTNMTITGITPSVAPQLDETVEDATGKTIETRLDNILKEATITGRVLAAYSAPAIGDLITIAGLDALFNGSYEIKEIGGSYATGAYVEIELTIRAFEGITLA
jgi:hypothetical protein